MTTIVTDISKPLRWIARKDSPAALVVNCKQNGSAFDISGYNFTVELWKVGGQSALLSLTTVNGGIINGGASGTLQIKFTAGQLALAADCYRWYLKATHPDGQPYQWFNGQFVLNGELYSGSLSQTLDVSISLGSTLLDVEITLPGGSISSSGWNDRGGFDASGGLFPSTGGSGSSGAIMRLNTYLTTTPGVISGVFIPEGGILIALQDSPTNDFSITGWKLF